MIQAVNPSAFRFNGRLVDANLMASTFPQEQQAVSVVIEAARTAFRGETFNEGELEGALQLLKERRA